MFELLIRVIVVGVDVVVVSQEPRRAKKPAGHRMYRDLSAYSLEHRKR